LAGAYWGGSHGTLTDLAIWLAGAFVLEGVFTAPTVLRVALRRPDAWRHARGRPQWMSKMQESEWKIPAQRAAETGQPSRS